MNKAIGTLLFAALLAGCSKPAGKEETNGTAKEKPRSSAGQAVDYMTGKTAVKAGKKARDVIEDVSSRKENDLEQVLGK